MMMRYDRFPLMAGVALLVAVWVSSVQADVIFSEDFSSGVGALDQTSGNGATDFPLDPDGGEFIKGEFVRGSGSRRYASISAHDDSVAEFGYRMQVNFTFTNNSANARFGFTDDSSAPNVNAVLGRISHVGADLTQVRLNAIIYPTTGSAVVGSTLDLDKDVDYFLEASWDGNTRKWEIKASTGNYLDSGGLSVGSVEVVLPESRAFSVDQIGLSALALGTASQVARAEFSEIEFNSSVIPEPASIAIAGLGALLMAGRRRPCRPRR